MNIIKLMGGLGNQLFQYAFGQALLANGSDVAYDKTWYKISQQRHPRPLHLDKFHICGCTKYETFKHQPIFKETDYDLKYLQLVNHNFSGYWQYLPYFEKILPQLQAEFVLQEKYYTPEYFAKLHTIQESYNSISIHVRRGDYLNQKGWGALKLHYYLNAVSEHDGDIFVFSDDLPWCKSVFKPQYFKRSLHFVGISDLLDFDLMQKCKNQVISNSTYSYWAAMLNKNEGTIYCPEHWLGETEPDLTGNHYPKHWIKITDYVNH